jgi:type VI secretion system secreted protein Hcp
MAVDYFLKLSDKIEGESADEKHKKEVQLMSWSWGGSQTTTVAGTGGSGAGKASLSDFSVMTYFDKSTPQFFKALCKGQHIATGTMTAVKAGSDGSPYLTVDLEELFVTSLQISASSEVPTISISFSYNKIKIEYFTQDEKGQTTSTGAVTYETKANKLS